MPCLSIAETCHKIILKTFSLIAARATSFLLIEKKQKIKA